MTEWNIELKVARATWAVLDTNVVQFFEDLSAFLYHCADGVCMNDGVALDKPLRIECTKSNCDVSVLFVLPPLGRFPLGNLCSIKERLLRFMVAYLTRAVEQQVGESAVKLQERVSRSVQWV